MAVRWGGRNKWSSKDIRFVLVAALAGSLATNTWLVLLAREDDTVEREPAADIGRAAITQKAHVRVNGMDLECEIQVESPPLVVTFIECEEAG